MRKGEKKRFTKFTNDDDEKRREKKKKSTFPRARDAARSWPGYFLFDSADGHPHCASVEGARFSSQPPGSEGKRGEEEPPFFTLKRKRKTGTNRDEKKKKSVGRTARSSNFSSAPWSSALGTPLGSARNTARTRTGSPRTSESDHARLVQVAAFAETVSSHSRGCGCLASALQQTLAQTRQPDEFSMAPLCFRVSKVVSSPFPASRSCSGSSKPSESKSTRSRARRSPETLLHRQPARGDDDCARAQRYARATAAATRPPSSESSA